MNNYTNELINNIESACIDYIPKDIYKEYLVSQFDTLRNTKCKNCLYSEPLYDGSGYLCTRFDISMGLDDYCSRFENKLPSRMTNEYKE